MNSVDITRTDHTRFLVFCATCQMEARVDPLSLGKRVTVCGGGLTPLGSNLYSRSSSQLCLYNRWALQLCFCVSHVWTSGLLNALCLWWPVPCTCTSSCLLLLELQACYGHLFVFTCYSLYSVLAPNACYFFQVVSTSVCVCVWRGGGGGDFQVT